MAARRAAGDGGSGLPDGSADVRAALRAIEHATAPIRTAVVALHGALAPHAAMIARVGAVLRALPTPPEARTVATEPRPRSRTVLDLPRCRTILEVLRDSNTPPGVRPRLVDKQAEWLRAVRAVRRITVPDDRARVGALLEVIAEAYDVRPVWLDGRWLHDAAGRQWRGQPWVDLDMPTLERWILQRTNAKLNGDAWRPRRGAVAIAVAGPTKRREKLSPARRRKRAVTPKRRGRTPA